MHNESPQKKLGDRIRQKRLEKNLSQQELGQAINYSTGAISYFESGERDLKAIALFTVAETLDCSVDDLNPFG